MNIREKILVVEDEKSIAHFISTVLANNGYEAMQARSGSEAISMISSHCPDLIILDFTRLDFDIIVGYHTLIQRKLRLTFIVF